MSGKITQKEISVILNSTHDAMIAVNKEGMITIFNAAAQRISGIRARDALGTNVLDVIPTTRLPEVLKTGEPELNRQQEINGVTVITNRVPVKDEQGEIRGAVAIFRDITDIRELAQKLTDLQEVRSLFEAIIHSTQDAISVCDEKGIQILVNPAYTRITGLGEADVLNRPCTVDIAEGESVHMQVLSTQKPVRGVRMKVGPQKREVVVNVAPILVEGKLRGSVGIIQDIHEIKQLTEELEHARSLIRRMSARYTFDDIVGAGELMQTAVEQARRAAGTPATVMLRGESGTGKELFAHAIHNASSRKNGPFVRVNCAAIAESILESELFGYVEGAFTGALRGGKKGYFEEANDGTIFLDEIGEINLAVQAKLLRVLQERELVRVGGTKPVAIDVRVIAATNANLEQRIKDGTFREDLYYRLNVIPIFVPPLRARKDDISLLVDHLRRKFGQEYGRKVAEITPEVLKILMAYDWPGNIRELENVISRTIINMKYNEEFIHSRHVPPLLNQDPSEKNGTENDPVVIRQGRTLEEVVSEIEKRVIMETLQETGGNKTEAARKLGIATRSLYYKLERYGLG